MMKSSISMVLLLASFVAIVLSTPFHNQFDNLPECLQPHESGLCLAYFERYYYDSGTDSCKTFVYGGCRGTANNFATEQECMDKCKGFKLATIEFNLVTESNILEEKSAEQEQQQPQQSVENPCTLPSVVGDCRAALPRLFYNAATSQCEEFIYGGCNGNENNFKTVEECQQRCQGGPSEEASSAAQDAPKVEEPVAESVAKNE